MKEARSVMLFHRNDETLKQLEDRINQRLRDKKRFVFPVQIAIGEGQIMGREELIVALIVEPS